nr:uncharacterized protein LOC101867327 [Macaca fascicularis]
MTASCWAVVCSQEKTRSISIAGRTWDPQCTHPEPWRDTRASLATSAPSLGSNCLIFSIYGVQNICPTSFRNVGQTGYLESEGEEERPRATGPKRNPGTPALWWLCPCAARTRKHSG